MKRKYHYEIHTEHGQPVSVVVMHRGESYVANMEHPHFDLIVQAVESQRPAREVVSLFSAGNAIVRGFKTAARLLKTVANEGKTRDAASRVTMKNGGLYFDGEPMHGALADAIIAHRRAGNDDFLSLARMMAKIMENPSQHSRENLYDWMKHLSFSIHEDGDIIGYKAVDRKDDKLVSRTQGVALVNGKQVRGNIPNDVGSVVEMERGKVTANPRVGCSQGLHVGTVSYARAWASVLIEVKVNPRDVVSVPTDCNFQKLRCCRYEVLRDLGHANSAKVDVLAEKGVVQAV